MDGPIYLDTNATTPLAGEVLEAMVSAWREVWGNASSTHFYGRPAKRALERAREQVAGLLGARPEEIVFTSGGTEADNLAIIGAAEARSAQGRHIVISAIEHPAVEEPCAYLERRGWKVTRVPVDAQGRVDPQAIAAALTAKTALVSVMHANNETGVLQPVAAIARICRERGVTFHSDAAQSVGKIAVRVDELGVDLLTVAAHKFYGPKGIGALYVRTGTRLEPLLRGAGHERGLRSGTEPVPLVVGLGAAADLAQREGAARERHLREMRDRLEARLRARVPDLVVHGAGAPRLPNTLYAAIPGADAVQLLGRLEGVAAGSGAACHSGTTTPSRVLAAMGVPANLARATLRLCVGRDTRPDEVDEAARRIADAAGR